MKGFEALAVALVAEGVDTVFGEISGGVDRLSSVLESEHGIRYVKVRHEEVAIGMADGFSRATGNIGVAIVGAGPGLSNACAPMMAARMAKAPVLVIAGGHNPDSNRHGPMLTDQPPLLNATIGAYQNMRSMATLTDDVALAFRHLKLGRGPIALQFPSYIANGEVNDGWAYDPHGLSTVETAVVQPKPNDIQDLIALIQQSERPVILAGRGAWLADSKAALVELSDRIGALLTTSLLARDWFSDNPYSVGVSGGLSTAEGVEILRQTDLLIAFGATLNDSTLGRGTLYPNAKFAQVDINPAVFNDINPMDKVVLGDAKAAAQALLMSIDRKIEHTEWRGDAMAKRIKATDRFKDCDMAERPGRANPRRVIDACDRLLPKNRVVLTDIGLFMGVPAAYMTVPTPGDIVFPWQLGRVGCGLPVALGAAVGRPDRVVAAFLGDGGMMAAMNALDTVKALDVPIAIIVMDDGGFGAERRIFEKNNDDTSTANYVTPDLVAIAQAYGLAGYKVTSGADMETVLGEHDFGKTAALIHVLFDYESEPIEMIHAGWA
jgi:acetolactate synthase-1/2/3 large subunit